MGLPPHRENERQGNQAFLTRLGREHHPQLRDVIDVKIDTVEAVAEVHLHKLDGTEGGVGEQDLTKDSIEGLAKLHGLDGSQREGLIVDKRPV